MSIKERFLKLADAEFGVLNSPVQQIHTQHLLDVVSAFIKEELNRLADECLLEAKNPTRNISWVGLQDAATIIRTQAHSL